MGAVAAEYKKVKGRDAERDSHLRRQRQMCIRGRGKAGRVTEKAKERVGRATTTITLGSQTSTETERVRRVGIRKVKGRKEQNTKHQPRELSFAHFLGCFTAW